jgi:non-lysosomal glucosylceramidase
MPRPDPARTKAGGCCDNGGCCGPAGSLLPRREFLSLSAIAAAAIAGPWWPLEAIAGPFVMGDADDFPIPADKKFGAAWLASLTARGEPTVYRSRAGELGFIGMPIGGICCGQVYLGGDGSLWHWDIFNRPQATEWSSSSGPLYAAPARQASPIRQGFGLRVVSDGAARFRRLDASGFGDIEFQGQYPIGLVRYRDDDCPVRVAMEAFSPFCPLDEAMSGTPAIVLNYTLTNTSEKPVEVGIAGWLENAVLGATGREEPGVRVSRLVREEFGGRAALTLDCSARAVARGEEPAGRPDIVFEDWESGAYDQWTATGTAFGDRPRKLSDVAAYQGNLNAQGEWTVNSHQTRQGEDLVRADAQIGSLTSRAFKIERGYVSFRIGGGKHPGQTCVNLRIDGAVVRTATGADNNRMRLENFDVREFAGREARIEIVDGWSGAWGNIGCDDIVLCDVPRRAAFDMRRAPDFGSMSLSVVGPAPQLGGRAVIDAAEPPACFDGWVSGDSASESKLSDPSSVGAVGRAGVMLAPGESTVVSFVIAWCFPNVDREQLGFVTDIAKLRRWYATRFGTADDVRAAVIGGLDAASGLTRLWRDTWYDSTLPHWFLDRTFATVSTAATATCWRFDNGRFYGWEGTYCCAGTCTHVWHYAQGLARVFPGLERSTRELVDFGLAFDDATGRIDYRAEAARELAVDGQCGTILRAYREHQMSSDDGFLRRIWPRVKGAIRLMLGRDPDGDGVLDGAQYNTLDTTWYGQIAWLTSLYVAALRAGEAMAGEMNDAEFAALCAGTAARGSEGLVGRLFNGEYFVHRTDPAHPEANSTGDGCHIDQLLGQSWAHQVGLGRVVPLEQSRSALGALYRYSFAPDVGPYRAYAERLLKGGRWYAMPGEGGLLMCTWPKGGAGAAAGKGGDSWAAGYFNECMSGFEHQVASHMIAEGLVTEGLAITRMIHDRYHAKRRNPWNEVECSNHYARAMASYGSFIAATGFEHHGPRGTIGFGPRLSPDEFRSAFIGAGGWGQFRQRRSSGAHECELEVRRGSLRISAMSLEARAGWSAGGAKVRVGERAIACAVSQDGSRVTVTAAEPVDIRAGETLRVELSARADGP